MSNDVLIKTGKLAPPNGALKYKQLGYAEVDESLYIGTSELDSEGKNIPKKLNKTNSVESIFNILYPIGSVYFTEDNNFNPNNTNGWSGTWENVSGCYLYLGEEQDNIGYIEGDNNNPLIIKDHYLTEDQLANHSHTLGNLSVDSTDLGSASGSVSGSLSGSASHSHSVSGTASYDGSHQHRGYYRADISAKGSSQALCTDGNANMVSSTNTSATTSAGSHSHSVSGTATSETIYGSSFSFNGSTTVTIGAHNHSISGGDIGNTGQGAAIQHDATLNPPRFMCVAWKRIA